MEELVTWRCAAMESISASFPPYLVYSVGKSSTGLMIATMFRYVNETDAGDIYVVIEQTARSLGPARFEGGLSHRKCERVQSAHRQKWPFPDGGHYSWPFTMLKIDFLLHIPSSLSSVVLLDADTYVLPGSGQLLADQLGLLSEEQSISVARSGVRDWQGGRMRHVYTFDGPQGGAVLFSIPRFRIFQQQYCGARAWYHCVSERMSGTPGRPIETPLADQSVWQALQRDKPHIFRYWPCGMHAETQVLQGITNLLVYKRVPLPTELCNEDGHHHCITTERWLGNWKTADDCLPEHKAASPLLPGEPFRVALTHGAAGCGHIARIVGAALQPFRGDVHAAIAHQVGLERQAAQAGVQLPTPPSATRFAVASQWYHKVSHNHTKRTDGPSAGSAR